MNKILKAVGGIACAFVICFLAIGYALVQDELLVNGSLSIEGEPLPATFVFDSNYLKPASENAEYNVYGDTVDIVLFNHDGLDVTVGNLSYTLTCDNKDVEFDKDKGELADDGMYDNTHTLKYSGEKPASITVTATSSSPGKKELKATFNFVSGEGNRYRIIKDGNVVTLDIVIGNKVPENGITVNCGKLAPNNTYGLTLEWFNDTTYTITEGLETNTPYTLLFFISGESQEININVVSDYTEIDGEIKLTK